MKRKIERVTSMLQDDIQLGLAQERHVIEGIVSEAQKQFSLIQQQQQQQGQQQQDRHDELYRTNSNAVSQLTSRVEGMEIKLLSGGGDRGDHGERRSKGMVNTKDLKPSIFSGKTEEWRAWIDEVLDFAEANHPGIREVLEKAEKFTAGEANRQWLDSQANLFARHGLMGDSLSADFYTVLKTYTGAATQPRQIVLNTPDRNGFHAWQKLFAHFQPEIAAREARAFADVLAMHSKRAKNPAELRGLIVDLEVRLRICRELCPRAPDPDMMRSVLIGMLDPDTRRHTVKHQSMAATYAELKTEVLQFINANVSDAMEIGLVGETEYDDAGAASWGGGQHEEGNLDAMGQWNKGKGRESVGIVASPDIEPTNVQIHRPGAKMEEKEKRELRKSRTGTQGERKRTVRNRHFPGTWWTQRGMLDLRRKPLRGGLSQG